MLNKNILAMVGATVALALGAAPAMAQSPDPGARPNEAGVNNDRVVGEAVPAGRIGGGRNENRNRRQPQAGTPVAAPTPEQIKVAAQAQAVTSGLSCQVSEAVLLGVTAEQAPMYEAACTTGPGYILVGSTPPQAVDCVILAGQAAIDRARDPAAVIGTQCALPANADVLRVISAYAVEAGIPCAVDQGASIGKSTEDNIIYEVGCTGVDGFWLEKTPTGWLTTECLKVLTQSATCKFTTPAEQAASVKALLVGSAAAGCDVTEARYMGANANGAFYEAKCGDAGGYIARVNTEKAVQEVYPCADAARIGGGCKLTAATETTTTPAT